MSQSPKTITMLTCDWPTCRHTWQPRGKTLPAICPKCKHDWPDPGPRVSSSRMNPVKRAKMAIAQLIASHIITEREALTFLVRAGMPWEDARAYIKDFEFPLHLSWKDKTSRTPEEPTL